MQAAERLWLTADRARLVPEGHADAATLYAAVGDEIPESAVQRFRLVEGRLGSRPARAAAKERKPAEDKEQKGGSDKTPAPGKGGAGGTGVGTQKAGPDAPPDDLTRIRGIGPATAAKLNEVGITTFAELATFGDGSPVPPVDGASLDDWQDWASAAAALVDDGAPAPGLTINKRPGS